MTALERVPGIGGWLQWGVDLLAGRMPDVSRGGMALFRWTLGVLMALAYFGEFEQLARQLPSDYSHRMAHFGSTYFPPAEWIAGSMPAYRVLEVVSLGALLFFAAGWWPRLAVAVAGIGLLLLELVNNALGQSVHALWIPTLTILGLALVPWDRTFALGRRTPPGEGAAPAGPGLAFGLWLPGFMLGYSYLGAGLAKLNQSGLAWITSGAVRYHWIEDAGNAPLNWGLIISQYDALTVFLSAVAVVLELAFILVIFCRSERWRGLFALAGLGLHAGLFFFQGLFWTHWWALYLAFLPWRSIYARVASAGRDGAAASLPAFRFRVPQAVWVGLFAVQQAYASLFWVELEPVVSMWGMYSHTFESREAFWDHVRWWKYQEYQFAVQAPDGTWTDATERMYQSDAAIREAFVRAWSDYERDGLVSDGAREEVREAEAKYRSLYGEPIRRVRLSMDQRAVDYERGEFYWKERGAPLGTLDLETFDVVGGRPPAVAAPPRI